MDPIFFHTCLKPETPTCRCGNKPLLWHTNFNTAAIVACEYCLSQGPWIQVQDPVNATTQAEARRLAVEGYRIQHGMRGGKPDYVANPEAPNRRNKPGA
jgi:hypothetical protein